MATAVATTALGGVFNAFAFAGAGYLFQHLNTRGYGEEMKRHNKALEDLAKAKESFYENETKQRDRILQLRQQMADAKDDIRETNKALDLLRQVRTITYAGNQFSEEPQLSDFYKPSAGMEEYQMIVSGATGIGLGYLVFKII